MIKVTAYRGHIRNHKALCTELKVDQTLPRREKEERILTKALARWGNETGLHLHGMFAAAFEDDETGETVLLRDPFGTKTMYYCEMPDGRLLYGTMISDITSAEGFVKTLNDTMLQHYLSLTYAGGEETFYAGIKKLMPGHILRYREGRITMTRYWVPSFSPEQNRTLDDFAGELHATLSGIMAELEEDGAPAGSFLSGGVDSSYVLAMSKARYAYGVGYEHETLDESHLAAETAALLQRSFVRRLVQPEEYFAAVPKVMRGMEQPLGDASAIVFALGTQAAAADCRERGAEPVVYSGEGSDEFFGGYHIYKNAAKYGNGLRDFYAGNTNIMKEEEKQDLLKTYRRDLPTVGLVREIYDENEGLDPLARMCDVDIRLWLEGDIYLNVDKMSLAAGLEVRMPLTDLRIFDIASRIPSSLKVTGEESKPVIRRAASKVLPADIAYRKKLGFVVPIRYWLADPRYNADVLRLLRGEQADAFFHRKELDRMLDAYLGGYSDLWRRVWAVYTFLVWYEDNF